jgi:hypothetical protein
MTCGAEYPPQEIRYTRDCSGLLDVEQDLDSLRGRVSRELFNDRLEELAGPTPAYANRPVAIEPTLGAAQKPLEESL